MIPELNPRIVLAARPRGLPTPSDFRLETPPAPQRPPPGGVLLQTLWLSLDPYMRGRMSEGPSYAEPVGLGEVMCGGTVCRVLASEAPGFAPGDIVLAYTGWQSVAAVPAAGLVRLDPDGPPPSWMLGVLGMSGLTAYVGLLDLGQPQPGETVVVAAATGPVGATVGQIARLKGCRVVGIAGGAEKCALAVEQFGFDACVDHRAADFPRQLAAACPQGIDVYFENVGGAVLEAVIPRLNCGARVPVCGVAAWYNLTRLPDGPDHLPALMRQVLVQRVRLQGFIVSDHVHRQADFVRDMSAWLREGRIQYREEIIDGLAAAPAAFIGLLQGENLGKRVVRVAA